MHAGFVPGSAAKRATSGSGGGGCLVQWTSSRTRFCGMRNCHLLDHRPGSSTASEHPVSMAAVRTTKESIVSVSAVSVVSGQKIKLVDLFQDFRVAVFIMRLTMHSLQKHLTTLKGTCILHHHHTSSTSL
jgi:hypothetical protein